MTGMGGARKLLSDRQVQVQSHIAATIGRWADDERKRLEEGPLQQLMTVARRYDVALQEVDKMVAEALRLMR